MRKTIALLLALVMCLTLCACGDDFEGAYSENYAKISKLNDDCIMLCKTTLDVWDRVGTEQAGDVLAYMLSVTDDFDEFFDDQNIDAVYNQYWLGKAYGWLCNTSFGISVDTDAKECWEFCLGYRDLFIAVKEQNEELSTTIKEMRSEYADKHSSEFSLIDDLYVEVSTFAEFALRPSGSLMNYNSEFGEYQTSTSKFLKSADIY